jgi:adenylosuccinate synthase
VIPNVSPNAIQNESEEWDFKPFILQLIHDGATDSQKLGMAIIEYQSANNWDETGKEAFNLKSGLKKTQSYINTIRDFMKDSVEVEGTGPKFNFSIRNEDPQ